MAREEAVFTAALARPAADRATFVEQACDGDTALRVRVEALLAAHACAASFLDPPVGPFAAARQDGPGDRIGRYKLLQQLGEGGCGVVYMAEQGEPVRRRVALKIIKAGMDTRDVVARFTAERQALALMDHPGIAKVLDAGATENGRPYFVMELVRGIPITHYCDQERLGTAARLELFVHVCDAVQHAHQKGIIHRDIKPSNILVAFNNAIPVAKVIDFGIAKATQGNLASSTLVTRIDQFIGTPVYMSPEQAELGGLDIDTRSDVYSLGALLYELLTGRPPFDPKAFSPADREGMRRLIREVEPPRPSACVAQQATEERARIARQRATDSGRLVQLLTGDLDWIVTKAMDKNRARRYDTPNALAADIGRHLHHEPVLARPPSKIYRFRRSVRRNRAFYASAAAIALTLAAGTAISAWQAVRARSAENLATMERARALEERARADDLLVFMLEPLREQLVRVGRIEVLETVGDKAMEYFASLRPQDLDDARLASHAKALTQIGQLRMDQARYPEAQQAYAAAYDRTAALVARNPRDTEILFARAQAEYGLGFVHYRRGERAALDEWLGRYRATSAALIALDPLNSRWQREAAAALHSIAAVRAELGELEPARESYLEELETLQKILARNPKDIDVRGQMADATSWLGSLAERSGDYTEALRCFRDQSSRYQELLELDPGSSRWRLSFAESLSFQADVLAISGQRAAALALLEEAAALSAMLVAQDEKNRRWLSGNLIQQFKQAALVKAAGDPEKALPLVEKSRAGFEQLTTAEPSDRRFSYRLAVALRMEAELRHVLGQAGAAALAQRAIDSGQRLLRSGKAIVIDKAECARACLVAGYIAAAERDDAGARRHWNRAAEILAPLQEGTRDWRTLDPAARVAAALGRVDDAQKIIWELTTRGYLPVEPWPEISAPILVRNQQPQ